jgi:arachidonate 5-lipoxygenase
MNARLYLQGTVLQANFLMHALRTGERGTHPLGVGAAGSFTANPDSELPPNEFFASGRVYPVVLRHASVLLHDDAGMDVRGASLRIGDTPGNTLELVLNSGPCPPYANGPQFFKFSRSVRKGAEATRKYGQWNPLGWQGGIGRLRVAPSSFARIHYYTQAQFHYRSSDGVKRYVRMRLLPLDDGPEDGLPTQEALDRLETLLGSPRLPGETRPKDYLRQEFKDRLAAGPVEYRLQGQLHVAQPDDSPEVFNPSRAWDGATHPFFTLGRMVLDRALPDAETDSLAFSVGTQPPSLGLITPTSPEDYNSISYLRVRAYRASATGRVVRRALSKRF